MWAFTTAAGALGHKSMAFKFHSRGAGEVQLRLGLEANRKAVATTDPSSFRTESVAATEKNNHKMVHTLKKKAPV